MHSPRRRRLHLFDPVARQIDSDKLPRRSVRLDKHVGRAHKSANTNCGAKIKEQIKDQNGNENDYRCERRPLARM